MKDRENLKEIAQIILAAAHVQASWQLDFRTIVRFVDHAGPDIRKSVVSRESGRQMSNWISNTMFGRSENIYELGSAVAASAEPQNGATYLELFPLWDAICEQAAIPLEPVPIAFSMPAPSLGVLEEWSQSTQGWPYLYKRARFFFARRSRSQRMR